jgi:cytochrome c-type biogenesis protein CcmH
MKINPLCLCGSLCLCGGMYREMLHHRDTEFAQRHRGLWLAIVLLFASGLMPAVRAQTAQPIEDPAIEARMKNLTRQLRCVVCQSETLAESQAEWAQTVRREIREQLKAGKSDPEITAYLTQRYGDFILYNPPVKATTYLLWFGPFLLLVIGTVLLFRFVKQRRAMIEAKPLTAEERRRAEKLLRQM